MELERALFRVYDRSMEGLVRDQPYIDGVPWFRPSKLCTLIVHLLWIWAVALLALTAALHISFVGEAGCIGRALADLQSSNALTAAAAAGAEPAAKAGPPVPPSQRWLGVGDAEAPKQPHRLQGQGRIRREAKKQGSSDDADRGSMSSLNEDDLLQIRMLPLASDPSLMMMKGGRRWSLNNLVVEDAAAASEFVPDYIFTQRAPLLYLDVGFLARHAVRRINVTVDEGCVTKGPGWAWLLGATAGAARGLDTVVVNQLMFSLRGDGFLRNFKTNETWSWRASQLPPPGGYDWLTAFSIKCGVLVQAALAFLLTSAVTAIVVRMLLTSGVVVLFPLFFLLRRVGVLRMLDLDFRLLSLSYPWLGVPMQRLRARRKPLAPFIMAHVVRVVVLYVMYEASQMFLAQLLYGKSVPAGLEFACFGIMMLLEYFALIFCRSAPSIRFFPRAACLLLLAFHCYLYAVPYGFTLEALFVAFLLLLCAATYTVLALELPACRSSVVSLDAPRAFFSRLETPAAASAIPPSWSLFLPLNALAPRSVYAEEVPERPSLLLQQIIVEMDEGAGGGAFPALDGQGPHGQQGQEQEERRRRRPRRRSRESAGSRSEGEGGGEGGTGAGQGEGQEHRGDSDGNAGDGDHDEDEGETRVDEANDDTAPLIGGPYRRSHDQPLV